MHDFLIDSHCHIYPEAIAMRAVASVDSFYDGLPDVHLDGTPQTLLRTGREAGIGHFIVHSVATSPRQVAHINAFLARSVGQSKGAFTGLGTLHPDSEDVESDFEALIGLGLRGVKLHPDIQRFPVDSPKAFRIYELCQQRDVPVLVHTGDYRYDYSNPNRTRRVLEAFPHLRFIGAHFGGWSVWEAAAETLARYPQLVVDTSSSFHWLGPARARAVIHAYGAQRVMFGTDYPFWTQSPEISFLEALNLTAQETEAIAWRTCAQLYGIQMRA